MDRDQIIRLFRSVALRGHVVSLARWFYRFAWVCVILYAALFFASRLFAVIPDHFEPATLWLIPAAALVLALTVARRPMSARCARMIDERSGTKDLFLTAALLEKSPGEFQPVVAAAAAEKARTIRAETVVPFEPWRKTGHISIAMLLLLVAVNTSFQFDPFGRNEDRKQLEDREKKLVDARKETQKRTEALKRSDPEKENTRAIESAVEDLKQELQKLKPDDPTGNLQKLREQQKEVGEKWKDLSQKKLAEALKQQ